MDQIETRSGLVIFGLNRLSGLGEKGELDVIKGMVLIFTPKSSNNTKTLHIISWVRSLESLCYALKWFL